MIPLGRDEMRGGIIMDTPHDSAKHYNFCRSRLYYTWKLKDVKAVTAISLNYEIF